MIRKICEDRAAWSAFSRFANTVLLAKESAERDRERRLLAGSEEKEDGE